MIPAAGLQHPASLAVAADGTLYVIDAGRLMVLRALPPGQPLAPGLPPPLLPPPDLSHLPGVGDAVPRTHGLRGCPWPRIAVPEPRRWPPTATSQAPAPAP